VADVAAGLLICLLSKVKQPTVPPKGATAMMLAYRLVRLIETHSDQLATDLVEKLRTDPKTCHYGEEPTQEFKEKVSEIYRHLGEWLLGRTESDIERRYVDIGERRSRQGVALSQLICAINLVKTHLLEFLKAENLMQKPAEVLGGIEILQLLEQFFDRAVYYAAVGYERTAKAKAAAR
jgi:hypothetical protein